MQFYEQAICGHLGVPELFSMLLREFLLFQCVSCFFFSTSGCLPTGSAWSVA